MIHYSTGDNYELESRHKRRYFINGDTYIDGQYKCATPRIKSSCCYNRTTNSLQFDLSIKI